MALEVSVVLPIYNEAENVGTLLTEIQSVFRRDPALSYEIIAVNDGSTDGSGALLEKFRAEHTGLKVIHFKKNAGQSAAFDAGFQAAQGRYVASLDADLQNDPAPLLEMISLLKTGPWDVVTGWRRQRQDGFWLRRLPSQLANRLIRWVTKTKVHDLGCSLRVYRREVIQGLRLYGEIHRFLCPLLEAQGARIHEIPVHHRPRRAGQSKYGLSRTVKVLLDLIYVWYLQNYQFKPLYIFGGMGIGSMGVGLVCLVVTAVEKYQGGVFVHRNPLFMLSFFFILIGLQFFSVSLLADLVLRIYMGARRVLPYQIDATSQASSAGFSQPVENKVV